MSNPTRIHFVNIKDYEALIQSDPPQENIKIIYEDDNQTVKFRYIPPEKLEKQLFEVFGTTVQKIINDVSHHFDATKAHVSIIVKHPCTLNGNYEDAVTLRFDGVGAVPVNSVIPGQWKGSTKSQKVNQENLSVPGAVGLAFMNAARGIGPYFGANLNRHQADEILEGPPKKAEEEPKPNKVDKANVKKESDRLLNQVDNIKKAKKP